MRLPSLFLVLAACGGGADDDTDLPASQATCDDLTAAPLSEVPVEDWPDGMPQILEQYANVSGLYEVKASGACANEKFAVKLVPRGQEELLVVPEPWAAADILTCGCVTDPVYGDDTTLPIAAQIPEFEVYIEDFGEVGVNNLSVLGSGALFSPSQPLTMRACATKNVDPILGSAYEQFTAIVRLENGNLSGAITLVTTEGANETCELTEWEFIDDI